MGASNICVYCKSENDTVELYKTFDIFGNHYSINSCNVCKARFLSPNPTIEQLEQAYSDSYYGEKEEKFEGFTEKILDYFRKKRSRLVAKHTPNFGNILDIGCGNGRFLKYTLLYGDYNLYGIEMPGHSADRASKIKEITLKVGALEQGDFEDNYFDTITLFHVFEHLQEPSKTLQIISRILKSGGICVMSFPNIDSFQAGLFKGKWLHLDPPRHLFYFTPKDFERIMKEYGFEVEKTTYISTEQNPYGMIQSILNCFNKKREILFESMKGNDNYIKDVSSFSLFIQGLFFKLSFPIFAFIDIFEGLFRKGATIQFILRKK